MNRKLLLVIAIVVLLLALGGAAYFLFFQPDSAPKRPGTPKPGVSPAAETSPVAQDAKPLISNAAISPMLASDGRAVLYFDTVDKTLKSVVASGGQPVILYTQAFQNIVAVHWAPTTTKAILEYLDPEKGAVFTFLDYGTKTLKPIPQNIASLAWAPDGRKIVFSQKASPGSSDIFIANPDGTDAKRVLAMGITQLVFHWPTASAVFFHEKPAPGVGSSLFVFDPQRSALRRLLENVYGLSARPSPDGKVVLFSYTADSTGMYLGLSSLPVPRNRLKGETEYLSASFSPAFAENCSWTKGGEWVYCAVPSEAAQAVPLPFTFWSGEAAFDVGVQAFRVVKGDTKTIKAPLGLDAGAAIVTAAEDYMVILNRQDGLLYSVKL